MVVVRHVSERGRAGRWRRAVLVALVALVAGSAHGPAAAVPAVGGAATETVGPAMPVGDLPGWKQVTAEDFTGSVPLGTWQGSSYSRSLFAYSGYGDTTNRGWYDPARVLSVKDGVLDWYVHTTDGKPRVAAVVPIIPATGWGQVYGRYSMRFRSDSLENYKMVAMLWPDSDNWGEGEIDFMEVGELDAGNAIYANLYPRGDTNPRMPGSPTGYRTSTRADGTGWHVATVEWAPGSVSYWLDGVQLGTTTLSTVPSTRMHMVIQVETAIGLPMPPAGAAGHVQVDWITQYTRVATVTEERPAATPSDAAPAAPSDAAPAAPSDAAPAAVYRFWSPRYGNAHFFTTSAAEAEHLRTSNPSWLDEGVAFAAYPMDSSGVGCGAGSDPVYRFWSPVFQSHFFTISGTEKAHIVATDRSWTYEGVAFCAATSQLPGAIPLYRFWSPTFGKHFYTADAAEAHQLDVNDPSWDAEGVAYFVQPSAR